MYHDNWKIQYVYNQFKTQFQRDMCGIWKFLYSDSIGVWREHWRLTEKRVGGVKEFAPGC